MKRIDLNDEMMEAITAYHNLIAEVNELSGNLSSVHADHIVCKAGCYSCCMDFGVLPVEFFAILADREGSISAAVKATGEECLHLKDGLCAIYDSRPLICRTHGLPLLYNDGDDWQLSVCDLNFTGDKQPDFSEDNTFPQDTFNSRLFMINQEFMDAMDEALFHDDTLLDLSLLGSGSYSVKGGK